MAMAQNTGPSKNQLCVGIGCDNHKRSVFILEGYGKPSSQKTMDAFSHRIASGSTLVHDKEKSHQQLARESEKINCGDFI